jgi:stalled ribosome rescue protein Dom34
MANKNEFGVWMDSHHATIVGSDNTEANNLVVVAHVKGEENSPNSSEKNANNQEKTLQGKFFKEITSHMQNATRVHVTGTGVAQEQFIRYLADTPQFKNTKTGECTSNKMSDERLVEFMTDKLK